MYIITSKTKSKMYRNPSDANKLKEELKHQYQSQGLAELIPLKNQSIEQMKKDCDKAGKFFQEEMLCRREKRRKLKANEMLAKKAKVAEAVKRKLKEIHERNT